MIKLVLGFLLIILWLIGLPLQVFYLFYHWLAIVLDRVCQVYSSAIGWVYDKWEYYDMDDW